MSNVGIKSTGFHPGLKAKCFIKTAALVSSHISYIRLFMRQPVKTIGKKVRPHVLLLCLNNQVEVKQTATEGMFSRELRIQLRVISVH